MFAHCICVDSNLHACFTLQRIQQSSKLFNQQRGLFRELNLIRFDCTNMRKAVDNLLSSYSVRVVILQEIRIKINYTCTVLLANQDTKVF
jgi:hypothetical protein